MVLKVIVLINYTIQFYEYRLAGLLASSLSERMALTYCLVYFVSEALRSHAWANLTEKAVFFTALHINQLFRTPLQRNIIETTHFNGAVQRYPRELITMSCLAFHYFMGLRGQLMR